MFSSVKSLIAKSKQLFPDWSKSMRKQWVRKTLYLEQSGKHLLMSGKFAFGR